MKNVVKIKCHHLKQLTCKGLWASVYLSEAQNPIPPPTLCICVYRARILNVHGAQESIPRHQFRQPM
jgi:hypothetical protein